MRRILFLITLLLALAGCTAPSATLDRPAEQEPAQVEPIVPSKLSIPSLNLMAQVDTTGLNPDSTIAVPDVNHPERAAWVDVGPQPGEVGRALIVGHINGGGFPGVFGDLATIKPGEKVIVTDAEGKDLTYVVDRITQYPKDSFPSGRVYGDTKEKELALVTCGGSLDTSVGSYRDNIVVFTKLA